MTASERRLHELANQHSLMGALTPTERMVAIHLVQGLSNKEISTLLGKAEPTVKHQVSSILRTTNVQSRCQFIALYYRAFFYPFPFCEPMMVGPSLTNFSAFHCGQNCS